MKETTWADILESFISPENWVNAINDPNAFGEVLGGIASGLIAGFLAIGAGLFTLYSFLNERKRHNKAEFLEWLSQLNATYQSNENYATVREAFAQKRSWVRRLLTIEMLCDEFITKSEILDEDKEFIIKMDKEELKNSLDWPFLRLFTDYLYFFEQVLAFGQSLKRNSSFDNGKDLVNHFGWFLRSLCISWSNGNSLEQVKAVKLFIIYLANSRYRRLTEVCLCFLYDFSQAEGKECQDIFSTAFAKADSIFEKTHQEETFADSITDLTKKWGKLVGFVGGIKH